MGTMNDGDKRIAEKARQHAVARYFQAADNGEEIPAEVFRAAARYLNAMEGGDMGIWDIFKRGSKTKDDLVSKYLDYKARGEALRGELEALKSEALASGQQNFEEKAEQIRRKEIEIELTQVGMQETRTSLEKVVEEELKAEIAQVNESTEDIQRREEEICAEIGGLLGRAVFLAKSVRRAGIGSVTTHIDVAIDKLNPDRYRNTGVEALKALRGAYLRETAKPLDETEFMKKRSRHKHLRELASDPYRVGNYIKGEVRVLLDGEKDAHACFLQRPKTYIYPPQHG
jgi:hypothetical protein